MWKYTCCHLTPLLRTYRPLTVQWISLNMVVSSKQWQGNGKQGLIFSYYSCSPCHSCICSNFVLCIILSLSTGPFSILNTHHHTWHIWIVLHTMLYLTCYVWSQFIILRLHRFKNSCLSNRGVLSLWYCPVVFGTVSDMFVSLETGRSQIWKLKVKWTLLTAPRCKIQVSETPS